MIFVWHYLLTNLKSNKKVSIWSKTCKHSNLNTGKYLKLIVLNESIVWKVFFLKMTMHSGYMITVLLSLKVKMISPSPSISLAKGEELGFGCSASPSSGKLNAASNPKAL